MHAHDHACDYDHVNASYLSFSHHAYACDRAPSPSTCHCEIPHAYHHDDARVNAYHRLHYHDDDGHVSVNDRDGDLCGGHHVLVESNDLEIVRSHLRHLLPNQL